MTASRPAVSVVIPAFRAADFLPAAIERLERQNVEGDFEVIIVEDCSGDATATVAQHLAETHERVRVFVNAENVGAARSRERGVAEARGEYVWFVDADDEWGDDALRVLVALAKAFRADVVVAGAMFVYRDGRTRPLSAPVSPPVGGRAAFRMLLRGQITGHLWNKLFRRDTIAASSFAPARVQSDLAMVADALAAARRVAFTSFAVYRYVLRSGSIITSGSQRADSLDIIDEAVGRDASRLGLTASNDYRYFRSRYILLSGIKDALLADYPPSERAKHLATRRRALSWGDVLLFARRGDFKRLALSASAKVSIRAHRALLAAADR